MIEAVVPVAGAIPANSADRRLRGNDNRLQVTT